MKKIVLLAAFLYTVVGWSQMAIITWNIQNFGQSKSGDEIEWMAKQLYKADIIAVQEVVAGAGGAQAVAQLVDALNRKGFAWDYAVSNPTEGTPTKKERYAFIWKKARIKLIKKPSLAAHYNQKIAREPFVGVFSFHEKVVTMVNFHALPKKDAPESELKYFKEMAQELGKSTLFMGDFNCPQSHTVFVPLRKLGWESVLKNQKTSLKQKPKNNQFLASEYDNLFYNKTYFRLVSAQIIPFYEKLAWKSAKAISDHLPVMVWLQ